jgi:hypothetical protein
LITTPTLFARLLETKDVDIDAVISAITEKTKRPHFRSSLPVPSGARMHQPNATQIDFPEVLPYIAGYHQGRRLHVTSVVADERLRWYSDQIRRSVLVVREMGGRLPQTVMDTLIGMDANEVVRHPALEGAGCTILHAHTNAASLQLTVEMTWSEVPMRLPAAA